MKIRGTRCIGGPADGNYYDALIEAGDRLHIADGDRIIAVYQGTGRTIKSRVPSWRNALYYEALYLDPEHDELEQLWAAPAHEPELEPMKGQVRQ